MVVGLVAAALLLGWLGYTWRHSVPLKTITITGNSHVGSDKLNERVGIEGDTLLYAIDTAGVIDRLLEEPWVASATIRRWPTGTMAIQIVEREPVALVMRSGRPAVYLDRYGVAMRVAPGNPVDVPVVASSIVANVQPGDRVDHAHLQEMLDVLAGLDERVFDLVSEVDVAAESVALYTTPLPDGPSIRVELGADGFAEKMGRLAAFWADVVLGPARPEARTINRIDLRYDGQIITS